MKVFRPMHSPACSGWRVLALAHLLAAASIAQAQLQTAETQRVPRQSQAQSQEASDRQLTALDARDRAVSQMWGLNEEEMQRAKLLQFGPRGSFSVPNLSPVEALGIHARSDAERRKYAEMFARAQYADVQRVLAFQRSFDAEMAKLTAGQPMISFDGLPKVNASVGAADMMNVPRTQLTGEAGAPSSRAMRTQAPR